jgi:hypothetical protein
MEAQSGSRGIALLFLNLSARRGWLVDATPRLFTDRKDPVSILQEAGLPQGQSGGMRKISSPLGFKARTLQPVARHCTDCTVLYVVKRKYKYSPDHVCIVWLRIKLSALIQL